MDFDFPTSVTYTTGMSMQFSTVKNGADTISQAMVTAYGLWNQGSKQACVAVMRQALEDARTLKRQIEASLSEVEFKALQ